MAVVNHTRTIPDSMNQAVAIVTWTAMANGDTGSPLEMGNFSDRSVQVVGTFGAAGSVAVEGSLDGTNYSVLTDPQGNPLDITETKIEAVSELVRYIRPHVTAGDGTTALTVTILAKRG